MINGSFEEGLTFVDLTADDSHSGSHHQQHDSRPGADPLHGPAAAERSTGNQLAARNEAGATATDIQNLSPL